MYYYVAVLPNSGDNWITSSPFSTALSGGQLGFVFGSTPLSSLSSYKQISGRLLDVSDLDESVDIFGGSQKEISGELNINGVGGVAECADFCFTLDNITSDIQMYRIIGRQVKVCLDLTNNSMRDIGHTNVKVLFVGRIKSAKPGRFFIEFTCGGSILGLKSREIGKLTNFDSDIYKGKIFPINYGNLTDSNAFIRTALNKNLQDIPSLVIDEKVLSSITNICLYDKDAKIKIDNADTDDFTIDANNNLIEFKRSHSATGITLLFDVSNSESVIRVDDPQTTAFEFSPAPSPALDTTSIYSYGSNRFQFVEIKDDYYIFTTYSNIVPSVNTGTLTKVSGTGPSTIIFTYRSEIIESTFYLEQSGEDITSYSVGGVRRVSTCTQPLILKVDDEYMQVVFVEHVYTDSCYISSKLHVYRGYNGSLKAAHLNGAEVCKINATSSAKINFKHYLWPSDISSFWNSDNTQYNTPNIEISSATTGAVPEALKYLTNMSRMGTLGRMISFADSDPSAYAFSGTTPARCNKFYLDLIFPKFSIKANIVNMYLLGLYAAETSGLFSHVAVQCNVQEQCLSGFVFNDAANGGAGHSFNINAGIGMRSKLLKIEPISNKFRFPYWTYNGINYTISALAWEDFRTADQGGQGDITIYNSEYYCTHLAPYQADYVVNAYEDGYNLFNKVERLEDSNYSLGYHRDFNLVTLEELNNLKFSIAWYYYNYYTGGTPATSWMYIANPGLLLELAVNPLDTEIFVQGVGRSSGIENPDDVIVDILSQELSFTDVTNRVTDRSDWKIAFSHSDGIISFGDLAQRICEQSGLIISDDLDGKLNISSLTPPESGDGLTAITDSMFYLENNIASYTEEYTTIDRLITDISVNYQINIPGEFYGKSFNASSIGSITTALDTARDILDAEQKVTVKLDHIRDEVTAVKLTELIINNFYNKPLRILTVDLSLSAYALYVGQWVTFSTTKINGTSSKVYLVVGKNIELQSDKVIKCKLLELDYNTSVSYYYLQNDYTENTLVYQNDYTATSVQQQNNGGV